MAAVALLISYSYQPRLDLPAAAYPSIGTAAMVLYPHLRTHFGAIE
jgi:hypothetical protein